MLILIASTACSSDKNQSDYKAEPASKVQVNDNSSSEEPSTKYSEIKIIEKLPHDTNAYTQGLYFYKGFLYETTGQYSESSLRKIDPNNGEILNKVNLPPQYFAEGMTIVNDEVYILTWMETVCFVYDVNTFKKLREYRYQGQGWGLTHNNGNLIMTNGSSNLYVYDLEFNFKHTIPVYYNNSTQFNLNELEFTNNYVFANIYTQDAIAVIDYQTGDVVSKIDASILRAEVYGQQDAEVLNGIAYDAATETFYLTGKNWHLLFKAKIN